MEMSLGFTPKSVGEGRAVPVIFLSTAVLKNVSPRMSGCPFACERGSTACIGRWVEGRDSCISCNRQNNYR